MKNFVLFFVLLSLTACASYEVTPTGQSIKTTHNYMEIIERHTDSVRLYSGFYNILDMEATLISSEVAEAQLAQGGMLYQWDETRAKEEKAKFESRLSRETEMFLSFYVPDRKQDDLFKANTIWRIFLDVDGKRYAGKATRVKMQLVEIEGLYPYHNRFYSPYMVSFPVSIRSIEGKPMKVTVTGAVGSGVLEFNKAKK